MIYYMMILGNFVKIPLFYANFFKIIDKIVWIFKNYCTFASSDSNNAHTYGSDKFNNLIFITMKTYSELIQYRTIDDLEQVEQVKD